MVWWLGVFFNQNGRKRAWHLRKRFLIKPLDVPTGYVSYLVLRIEFNNTRNYKYKTKTEFIVQNNYVSFFGMKK
jgi:hypothetical protein